MAEDNRKELMDRFADSLDGLKGMPGIVINVRTFGDGAHIIEVFDMCSGYSKMVPLAIADGNKAPRKR